MGLEAPAGDDLGRRRALAARELQAAHPLHRR